MTEPRGISRTQPNAGTGFVGEVRSPKARMLSTYACRLSKLRISSDAVTGAQQTGQLRQRTTDPLPVVGGAGVQEAQRAAKHESAWIRLQLNKQLASRERVR